MKKLGGFVLLLFCSLSFAAAKRSSFCLTLLSKPPMLDNSIANDAQTKEIYEWVLDHLDDKRENKVVFEELNSTLKKHQLPLIDLSSRELAFQIQHQRTFVPSDPIGVAISDGKNRFCFPCEIRWNIFKFGILPATKN